MQTKQQEEEEEKPNRNKNHGAKCNRDEMCSLISSKWFASIAYAARAIQRICSVQKHTLHEYTNTASRRSGWCDGDAYFRINAIPSSSVFVFVCVGWPPNIDIEDVPTQASQMRNTLQYTMAGAPCS